MSIINIAVGVFVVLALWARYGAEPVPGISSNVASPAFPQAQTVREHAAADCDRDARILEQSSRKVAQWANEARQLNLPSRVVADRASEEESGRGALRELKQLSPCGQSAYRAYKAYVQALEAAQVTRGGVSRKEPGGAGSERVVADAYRTLKLEMNQLRQRGAAAG